MRKSFNGLGGIVRNQMKGKLMGGDIFIFVNRRRNRLKLLVWDRTGFVIWYKRLEEGTFELPAGDSNELSQAQLMLILEGIDLASVKHRKRYNRA
jgi:transposase